MAYDPAHIPDCNVQATVGQHFRFNEPIPKAVNGRGYLRVTKKSLWWQHEQFPNVWTSEGVTTCMENGYQWTVNSTMWNHLQTMWQAPPLDLLRLVYEETHHQNILEASGYRSPTWQILRALQSIINTNVVVGESIINAAPFLEGAGRPSKPFWGPQQGRKVILWESPSPGDQEKCSFEMIQTGSYGVRPDRKTWSHKYSGIMASASLTANVRNQSRLATIKKSPRGADMLPWPEVGGSGGM